MLAVTLSILLLPLLTRISARISARISGPLDPRPLLCLLFCMTDQYIQLDSSMQWW